MSADEHDMDVARRPALTRLSDVTPERLRWLWSGRFPEGKLVVIDGDPSVGKSTLAVDFAARISTGTAWPDGSECPTADVLILSAEDGLADTIRPRLDAAGGDPSRVHALTALRYEDDRGAIRERSVSLADVDVIGAAIRAHGVRLVIVDVLMAYMPSGVDSHRDQDVRTVLAKLCALAESNNCCVLLLRHLNKTGGGNPLYRGGGSIGIVGAARAGFVAAPDPDDESRRVLACMKSNLAAMPPSLVYELVTADNGVARVEWHGQTNATASALLAIPGGEDRTERDAAREWLLEYLAEQGGESKAGDVIKAAKADGIAERTLRRATKRAGVTIERRGFGEGSVWSSRPQSGQSGQRPDADRNGLNRGRNGPRPRRCVVCTFLLDAALGDATTHPSCDRPAS